MNIKLILENLSELDLKLIRGAFDNETPLYLEYEKGLFIGVHLNFENHLNLTCKNVEGKWSYGVINEVCSIRT